jgi:2-polyprenyl-3-methyl-5-hydroxy-6-metoxy-1,4-benzoquinol methylase
MTLLARDEADVIEPMLDCHLALGVDFVIATDNGSVDGTTEILQRYERQGVLRLIHQPEKDYQAPRWVTRMARLAATDHAADWVINADADEFWWPREGDLKSALGSIPWDFWLVAAHRYNFVVRPEDSRPFHDRMRWRRTDSMAEDGRLMTVKVCHRADPTVEVAVGNHAVSGVPSQALDDGRIEILHYPHRSFDQYDTKIGQGAAALMRNAELGPEIGYHWRRAHEVRARGELRHTWDTWVYDDERVASALASAVVVEDLRVIDLLARRDGGGHAAMRPAIRHIAESATQADGDGDGILNILRKAADKSTASVELAEHIVDWSTRYHLADQRANLLRPLQLTKEMRVLHVGAGSGVLTRHLAEQGAEVVALESHPLAAAAATERCDDLPGVQVICGGLDELDNDERFDLVVLVDVLAGAADLDRGRDGAPAMLQRCHALLRASGAMVVATANRLGLERLLAGPEDHNAEPWIGMDGDPGRWGAPTWSRRGLGAMLSAAGLDHQRWLAPFPDHTLPSVVIDERLYRQDDAADLVEQLVQQPVGYLDHPPIRLADAEAAHAVFVQAGLGLDVANAFLVVAGESADAPNRLVDSDVLAWLHSGPRLPAWCRERVLTVDRTLRTLGDTGPRQQRWLRQHVGTSRPYYAGRTLRQQVFRALRDRDLGALGAVLRRWRDELDRRAEEHTSAGTRNEHPFVLDDSSVVLPDGHLDVSLGNFVETRDGLVLIDDEWQTGRPVDIRMAQIRALWVLAREVVTSGVAHAWSDRATVDEIMAQLATMAGVPMDAQVVAAWQTAEVELQGLVAGEPPERVRAGWLDGSLCARDLSRAKRDAAELQQLREEVAAASAELMRRRSQCEWLADQRNEFLGQIEHYRGVIDGLEAELAHVRTARGFARSVLARRVADARAR